MKGFLRSQIAQRAPAVFNGIRAIRNRHFFRRAFSRHQADFREKLFPGNAAIVVQSGPFKGLRYFDGTVWGSITPKWLGSYEAELHPIIHQIVEQSYRTIIDVGSAEGYYAVGLAVVVPTARIFAFDTDFISRAQVRRLAALNNVTDRLQIRGFCDHSELDRLSTDKTLVVCDIEGFETQLLDPALSPSLLRADVLVEVHETSESSLEIEHLLESRFVNSHRIQRVAASDRDSWIEQNAQGLATAIPRDALKKATEEDRATGRAWLWMQSHRA